MNIRYVTYDVSHHFHPTPIIAKHTLIFFRDSASLSHLFSLWYSPNTNEYYDCVCGLFDRKWFTAQTI